MMRLPLLRPHTRALELCVYCPKLSRAACPVSNVEHNETVTPWGKMSLAYYAARGDVPVDHAHAAPAWACSACYACRERCEHKNEVATVLTDARAELFERGAAPPAAVAAARRFATREKKLRERVQELSSANDAAGDEVLLLGCGYSLDAPGEGAAAQRVAERALGWRPAALSLCCGLPLLYAGDRPGFQRAAERMAAAIGGRRAIVADPGCAHTLLRDYPRLGVRVGEVAPLVDIVYATMDRFFASVHRGRKLRYHDPCQLGRGLGRYDEPRSIVARLTAAPVEELPRNRMTAECSGAGGLLPLTRPRTSRAMADERIVEHRAAGGGELVTACGSALRRFRSRGASAVDLWSLLAKACPDGCKA